MLVFLYNSQAVKHLNAPAYRLPPPPSQVLRYHTIIQRRKLDEAAALADCRLLFRALDGWRGWRRGRQALASSFARRFRLTGVLAAWRWATARAAALKVSGKRNRKANGQVNRCN